MLVERGLKVTNVEVVGGANRIRDAYAIASNDLRKTGAIPDIIASHDALLEIIVLLFDRIRLANRFETELV
jgi:hypothetical protein